MFLTYCLSDFEIVPVAPIITDITLVFTFHMRCISVVRYLFFKLLLLFNFLLKLTLPEYYSIQMYIKRLIFSATLHFQVLSSSVILTRC